jgi:outer membrane immunogenic protein
MKRVLIVGAFALLAGGQALAADLPPPVAPPPRAPAVYVPTTAPYYNWTGFYIGVNAGYGFGTVTPNVGPSFSPNGFLVGGTLGGNYQMGAFVVGLEGDGGYDSMNGTAPFGSLYKSNWLATVRGRAGWAWDRVLFFGTAGGAFAPATLSAVPGFAGGQHNDDWLDCRRRYRSGLRAQLDGQGRISLRRFSHANYCRRWLQGHREHHPRRRELQVHLVTTTAANDRRSKRSPGRCPGLFV